jgi:hypothetical protein
MAWPLLISSASNGTMLCWCRGVFLAAAGCERESITLKIGFNGPASSRDCSSSYVKSSVSVRGAYGLKSRICPRLRSRVMRMSNTSEKKIRCVLTFRKGNESRTVLVCIPPRHYLGFPKLSHSSSYFLSCFMIIEEIVVIGIPLRDSCNTNELKIGEKNASIFYAVPTQKTIFADETAKLAAAINGVPLAEHEF